MIREGLFPKHAPYKWSMILAKQGFGKQEQEYLKDFVFLSTAEEAGRRLFSSCAVKHLEFIDFRGWNLWILINLHFVYILPNLLMFLSQTASGENVNIVRAALKTSDLRPYLLILYKQKCV